MASSDISVSIWRSIEYGLISTCAPHSRETLIIHRYSRGDILEGLNAAVVKVVCVLVDVVCVGSGVTGRMIEYDAAECLLRAFVHNSDCQLLRFAVGRVLVSQACAPSHLNYVGLPLGCDIDFRVTLDPKAGLTVWVMHGMCG